MTSPTINGKRVVHYIYKSYGTPNIKDEDVDNDSVCADTAMTEHVDWSTKFPVEAYSVLRLLDETVGGVRIPVRLKEKLYEALIAELNAWSIATWSDEDRERILQLKLDAKDAPDIFEQVVVL